MKSTAKPVPSKRYRQAQRELHRLLELRGGKARNAALSLQEELEAEFVQAWEFWEDADQQALEMKMSAARHCSNLEHPFDHCTCYYEPQTNSRIVVTQPYKQAFEIVEYLTRALSVGQRIEPQIIAAPEWAFYYPGRATLVVVKFPPGYETILQALDRLWSPWAESWMAKN